MVALIQAPEGRHIVRSDFAGIERTGGGFAAIATKPGRYRTSFNEGETADLTVTEEEIPAELTLGPDWNLRLVGKDKTASSSARKSTPPLCATGASSMTSTTSPAKATIPWTFPSANHT